MLRRIVHMDVGFRNTDASKTGGNAIRNNLVASTGIKGANIEGAAIGVGRSTSAAMQNLVERGTIRAVKNEGNFRHGTSIIKALKAIHADMLLDLVIIFLGCSNIAGAFQFVPSEEFGRLLVVFHHVVYQYGFVVLGRTEPNRRSW